MTQGMFWIGNLHGWKIKQTATNDHLRCPQIQPLQTQFNIIDCIQKMGPAVLVVLIFCYHLACFPDSFITDVN